MSLATTRRGFLGMLATAIAGPMALDPERLLWRPGAKLISIPQPRTLLATNWITAETLRILANRLDLSQGLRNADYAKDFLVGERVTVKYPQRWIQ